MMPFSNITSHQDSQDRFTVGEVSGSSHDASGHRGEEPEVFPEAMKVIGILRERLTGGEKWEVSIIFQGPLGEMGFCWSLLCLEWFTWNKCILEAKSDSSYQKFEARNFWMFCKVSFVSALRQLQCQNYEGWVSPFCWRQVQEPLQDFQMRTTRGGRFFLEAADWHIVKCRDPESQARWRASRWIFCRSVEASWYHLQGEWAALGRGGTEKIWVT